MVDGIDIARGVGATIRAHWRVGAAVFVLAAGALGTWAARLPQDYSASAVMRAYPLNTASGGVAGPFAPLPRSGSTVPLFERVLGTEGYEQALREELPVDYTGHRIHLIEEDQRLLVLTATDPDPESAVATANAAARALIRVLDESRDVEMERLLLWTEAERERLWTDLKRQRGERTALADSLGFLRPRDAVEHVGERGRERLRELARARMERDVARRAAEELESELGGEARLAPDVVRGLAQRLVTVELERAHMLGKHSPSHPAVQERENEAGRLKQELEHWQREVPGGFSEQTLAELLVNYRMQEARAKARVAALESDDADLDGAAELLSRLESREVEQSLLREQIDAIDQRIRQLRTAKEIGKPLLDLISPARVAAPTRYRPLWIAAAIVVSAGLAGLVMIVMEYLDPRSRDPVALGSLFEGAPIVAFPRVPRHRFPEQRDPLMSESADRVRLRLPASGGVVLVSSAAPREGKTTVAAYLAASLAESGRRTLLIDGDLRRPALSGPFASNGSPRLAEILRGEAEPDQAECPTPIPLLHLIGAEPISTGSAGLLSGPRAAELIDWARRSWDAVVIDSSPLLTVPDAEAIALHADGLVLVVEEGRHGERTVSQLRRVVEELKTPLIAVSVNKSRTHPPGYREYSRRANG